MSDLLSLQIRFVFMVARLIISAYARGYYLTFGHAYRCQDCKVGAKNSLHKSRLAIDFNLFDRDGLLLTDGTGHDSLHDLWDKWGGAPRIEGDLNHYSLEYQGRR